MNTIALGIFLLLLVIFISMNLQVSQRLPLISGFVGGMFETNDSPTQNSKCGIDLPSCLDGKRCINGFCRDDGIPLIKETGLNVVP